MPRAGFPEKGPGWNVAVRLFRSDRKHREGAGFLQQGPGWHDGWAADSGEQSETHGPCECQG